MLKQNTTILAQYPFRMMGGLFCGERSQWDQSERRNKFLSEAGWDAKCGVPSGHLIHSSWNLPQKDGGMSAFTTLKSGSAFVGAGAAGLNASANLTSSTNITAATMQLVVSMIANILSTTVVSSGDLKAFLSMLANITSQSNVTAAIKALGNMGANIPSTNVLTNATVNAIGTMAATILSYSALTPEGIRDSIWNAIASQYNTSGTMGNKMNSAASSGDPWTASLPGSYVAGQAGFILGTRLDSVVSQLAGLVWEEALASHSVSGTTGAAINAAGASGDPWSIPLPGGYAAGTAGEILGNFESSVSGSSGVSTLATGFTLTTGIETNDYTDTTSENGTFHTIDDVGNTIDGFYEFSVGNDGVPSGVTFRANLNSGNDSLAVYGYRWATSSWDQVGTLPGTGNAGLGTYTFPMQTRHVGSGNDAGKVRVRVSGGSSNPRFDVDYLYVTYAVVSRTTSYNGLAQAGSINTLTFPASASAVANFYKPGLLSLTSGTGAGQSRRIDAYDGSTKIATVATSWAVAPDSTTEFTLLPWGTVRVSDIDTTPITDIVTAVWNDSKALTVPKFIALDE